MSNPKTIETVRSCLYEMNRVEEINIATREGLILEENFRDLPKSAPQLHTLCIGSYSSHLAFSIHEGFLCNTERLQRVKLINCNISWDSQLLTGLTHLTLEDSLEANTSIIEVLHALQQMPALTELDLKDSIPDDSGDPSTLLSIFFAFGYFAFRLRILLMDNCKRLLSILISPSQLQLVLTWPSPQPQYHVRALTLAFYAMNLHFLTQLRISTEDYIDPLTWVKTFGKLSLLERVYVQGYATHSFLAALVYKADKSKTAYCNVSFPKLRYIHVNCTDFAERVSIDMLLDWLMERYERNAEVQVLRLDDCHGISGSDIESLKEIVVDIIWDGMEQRKHEKKKEERVFDSEGNTIEDLDYENGDYFCKGSCSHHSSSRRF